MKKMLLMGAVVVALCSCGTKTAETEAEVKDEACVECTDATCTEEACTQEAEAVENVVTDAAAKVEEVANEVETTAEKVGEAVEAGKQAVETGKEVLDAIKK